VSDILFITSKDRTPKSYLDMARPLHMVTSDNTFKIISNRMGNSAVDTLELSNKLSTVLKETKSYELDELWENVEKALYDGKSLSTKATRDEDKLLSAFGLFYSALNNIDATAKSTTELYHFRTTYYDIRNHVENRFLPKLESKDKRNLMRAMNTTDARLVAIVERFNEQVEAGTRAGNVI